MTINTVNEAFELLKKYKGIDMHCERCELATDPERVQMGNTYTTLYREPQLRITATGIKDHGSLYKEGFEIDYIIFGSDLGDNSQVNKFIKRINSFDNETKQTLRLAWILANGYKYAVEQTQKKSHIDEGWHPRVVQYTTSIW